MGAEVEVLAVPEGQAVCAERVAERLKSQRYDVVTMVQGETSSGICTTELPAIARLCQEHGALAVVDAVCTLSTMPLEKDAWGIDVVLTGSQKGLSSLPGVALIAFSDAAWEQVQQHPGPRPHWCLGRTCGRKIFGSIINTTTRHRSRDCWPCTRPCGWFARKHSSAALRGIGTRRWPCKLASRRWA